MTKGLPKFTADISFSTKDNYHENMTTSSQVNERNIVPQACRRRTGNCTGFSGISSVTLDGETQTCDQSFQFPWIKNCNGDISSGCGICVW